MPEISAFSLLALFGITIVIGYIGSLIFHKTRVPDIVWLVLFGILVGPVFNLVDRSIFLFITPFLAALALLIILFDAGLNMDFYEMVRGFSRSIILAVLGVAIEAVAVGAFLYFYLGWPLLPSLLLGVMVGGTSSPIVVSLAGRMKISRNVRTVINLESIFTDPLVVVVSIAIINIMIQSNSQYSALSGVLSAFSIGAVIGLFAGIAWLFALNKLKGKPFDYMLTLAVLFLLYAFVESVSGSGAIAALFFGLVLGNGTAFSRMLKFEKRLGTPNLMKHFQAEISFFIRSFFFVYMGLIFYYNESIAIYGVAIALILIMVRLILVEVSSFGMALSSYEKNIMRVMVPRGLAAAVLAQLPKAYGLPNADFYANAIFVVILATVLYTSVATALLSRKANPGKRAEK
ncbi:MAG: cation:proton antiporter [Candidatus Aenigmarchaeota archaeon]|nr:cation:proton antiporter [Candidatus Aenigmarchaeota archaeon]